MLRFFFAQHRIRKGTAMSNSNFDTFPDCAFLRESQLVRSAKRPDVTPLLPFSAPTLWRKVKDGTFPKPMKLSSRVTAWTVGDIRGWISAQKSQSCGGEK